MALTRKFLLDKFEAYTIESYHDFCEKHDIEANLENFMTYLIDQGMISHTEIKRNTIRREFDELYPQKEHHKTKTVLTLAERFNVSERSVWNILKEKENEEPLKSNK